MSDRAVQTTVDDVLGMIWCAESYGHGNAMFMHFAADLLGTLTESECEQYARGVAGRDGYGLEDGILCIEALREFRGYYFTEEGARRAPGAT